MSNRRPQPPPPQEKATRWLTVLARELRENGQAIFLIEQLQPSWLPAATQRAAYVITSRLTEGLLFAMIPVLVFHELMQAELFRGLLYALTFAAVFAVIDILRLEVDFFQRGMVRSLRIWQAAVAVLAVVLAVTLVALRLGQANGLLYALFGLASGPAWVSCSARRSLLNDIQPVEAMRWTWLGALRGALRAAVIAALLLVVIRALPQGWEEAQRIRMVFDLAAPFVVLMGAIDAGLKRSVVETKTVPNQGIRLSAWSAACVAVGGLLAGGIIGLHRTVWVSHDPRSALLGLVFGLLCGLFLALLKGGVEVLRHGILRYIVSRTGYAPRELASFLDYAADELHFLQRVGGGYMFIHRSLQEYFASLEPAA